MELYSALEKSFLQVLGRLLIGGFGMGISVVLWTRRGRFVSGFRRLFFVE